MVLVHGWNKTHQYFNLQFVLSFCNRKKARKKLWNHPSVWLARSLLNLGLFLHKFPKSVFQASSHWHFSSSPRYTYGQPVEGKVQLSVCRDFDSYGRCKKSPVCQSFTKDVWHIIIILFVLAFSSMFLLLSLCSQHLFILFFFLSSMLHFIELTYSLRSLARNSGHLIVLVFQQAWRRTDMFFLYDPPEKCR